MNITAPTIEKEGTVFSPHPIYLVSRCSTGAAMKSPLLWFKQSRAESGPTRVNCSPSCRARWVFFAEDLDELCGFRDCSVISAQQCRGYRDGGCMVDEGRQWAQLGFETGSDPLHPNDVHLQLIDGGCDVHFINHKATAVPTGDSIDHMSRIRTTIPARRLVLGTGILRCPHNFSWRKTRSSVVACNQISYWRQRMAGRLQPTFSINGFGAIAATSTAKILRLRSAPFHRLPAHGGFGDLAGKLGPRAVHLAGTLLQEGPGQSSQMGYKGTAFRV